MTLVHVTKKWKASKGFGFQERKTGKGNQKTIRILVVCCSEGQEEGVIWRLRGSGERPSIVNNPVPTKEKKDKRKASRK